MTVTVRRLQQLKATRLKLLAADSPPFIGMSISYTSCFETLPTVCLHFFPAGEVKVCLENAETKGVALVRVREDEDDSCLWRLRTQDAELRTLVKGCMSDE